MPSRASSPDSTPPNGSGASRHTFGILDNQGRGSVAQFLQEHVRTGSMLSIVSAYFTIHAYWHLRDQLDQIGGLRFLFGEPRFVSSIDPNRSDKKAFKIEDEGLKLTTSLTQRPAAKACAAWIAAKVQIRSIRRANLLHGKMYHVDSDGHEQAVLGSSNFTVRGLGLDQINNIELNLVVDSGRDRADLKAWFDALWDDDEQVEDVRQQVLDYLGQLYANHAPQFIYFKTLFHLFETFLDEQQRSSLLAEEHQLIDSAIWQALFSFQRDGVKGIIAKILAYTRRPEPRR